MRIAHVAAEMATIAKVGGLADVVQGLTSELTKKGHEITIILPKYQMIPYKGLIAKENFKIFERGSLYENTVWELQREKLRFLFIEPHHPANYFEREEIYGYDDDILRFIYFSKCAADYLSRNAKEFDLLHLHDWHASLIAPLARDLYPPLKKAKILFTIHNIAHQGKCRPIDLDHIGMMGGSYLSFDKMQDPTSCHLINLMKGGIVYSDLITTVSPTYAKEILSQGECLEKTIAFYKDKLHGILNGIDTTLWNPEEDPYLAATYARDDSIKKILKSKEKNKKFLRKELRLKEGNMPIVASIGRLVEQKGPELIRHALLRTLEQGGQFVLLGAAKGKWQEEFSALKEELKTNSNVSFCFDFNEKLSHLLFGASDFLVIPSQFEPCGLTQMIALRYGTIPIVRKTGGLADTVFDWAETTIPEDKRNGFSFEDFSKEKLQRTLERAISLWISSPSQVHKLIEKGMQQDYSWKSSAKQYEDLYRKLMV